MRAARLVPAILLFVSTALPAAAGSGDYATLTLSMTADASTKVATTESKSYNLLPGRPSWPTGPAVEYRILNSPSAAAVEAAEATVDPYVTTRDFVRNDATTQTNPCTGQPNTVQWAPIDGPNGFLAQTFLCINKAHEIVGFQTTFDTAETWATDGSPTAYDIQAVATHEFTHIAGLDVVDKPADACLTMYFQTQPGETFQRTLGLGDKIGLDRLYSTGNTSPGPGCGA